MSRDFPAILLCAFLFPAGCTDKGSSPAEKNGLQPAPWFEDQAQTRGLGFQHESGHRDHYLLPEIMGGGAALADLDGDGDLDAYLIQGGPVLLADRPGNRLFLNQGDGHFVEVPDGAGAADTGYGMGVAAGDYDNDGDIDLYVTNLGRNVLLRNTGAGRFEDVSALAGVDDGNWGSAAAFLDLDMDGDLDLFLVNYVSWSPAIERECFSSTTGFSRADYCAPTVYQAPARDHLYRNNGDGTFSDVSDEAGLSLAFGNGLGLGALDANNDGLTDIFVANDMMMNQLWINLGDLHFQDEALVRGCAVDEHGVVKSGMGVAAADVDNDSDVDLLVMNLATQSDSFFRNQGPYFQDATGSVGLGSTTKRYTRFGVALADFDNDSQLDLYEANGAIAFTSEHTGADVYAEPNVLLRGQSGPRYTVIQPVGGTSEPLVFTSRGVAVGDVDNDGGLDLLVVNRDAPVNLLMNQVAHDGNWIRFRVLTRQGRDAHAATVSADVGTTRISRDVQTSGSYLVSNDPRVHMGLGDETWARDVTVRWPGGALESYGDLRGSGTVILKQGEGKEPHS
jgi:hypothetical protein